MAPTGMITAFDVEAASLASGHVSSSHRTALPVPPSSTATLIRSFASAGIVMRSPSSFDHSPHATCLGGQQVQRPERLYAHVSCHPHAGGGAVVADQLTAHAARRNDPVMIRRFDLH